MQQLYLYIQNHGKRAGIADYELFITEVFQARGVDVTLSDTLVPNQVNVIIDEFTNQFENQRIKEFKEAHSDTPLIFVLTEFITRTGGVESFNNFEGLAKSSFIAVFDLIARRHRADFPEAGLKHYFYALTYLPLAMLYVFLRAAMSMLFSITRDFEINNPIDVVKKENWGSIYLHMRYLGLKSMIAFADGVIFSHEGVLEGFEKHWTVAAKKTRMLGIFYPELNEKKICENIAHTKECFFEVTGSVTKERKRWMRKINFAISLCGMGNRIKRCKAFSFQKQSKGKAKSRGVFSLHSPQTKHWPYSSPTRIYRAISRDYNLPVVTKIFHQNPVEEICFVYDGPLSLPFLYGLYCEREKLLEFIAPRIERYNAKVGPLNDSVIAGLRSLCDTPSP